MGATDREQEGEGRKMASYDGSSEIRDERCSSCLRLDVEICINCLFDFTGGWVGSGGMRVEEVLPVGLALPPCGSAVTKTLFKCSRVLVSLYLNTHRLCVSSW